MTTDIPASLPERLADAEGELPADIVTAIGALKPRQRNLAEAIAQIVEPILARLAAAESAREAATRVCAQRASVIQILGHHPDMTIADAYDAAERARHLSAALARAERAEKALEALREPSWQALEAARNAKINGSVFTMSDWVLQAEKDDLPHLGISWPEMAYDRWSVISEDLHHILLTTWWRAIYDAALAHPATAEET